MIKTEKGTIETDGGLKEIGVDLLVVVLEYLRLLCEENSEAQAIGVTLTTFEKAIRLFITKDYDFEEEEEERSDDLSTK